jgi:Mn2+/Fe2+ NRAMP family transporter
MVCFADTDGPCLITAADSGAQWTYDLLSLQIVLIPILFFAQELTVRLGLYRGKGVIGVMRDSVGPKAAWAVAIILLMDCFLGLNSEMASIGQTMKVCWGIPNLVSNLVFCALLTLLALTGSYHVAEKVGLVCGSMQIVFIVTMFMAKPKPDQVLDGLTKFPIQNTSFIKLITANIGAVIMPWMLAYQQSALCNKGLARHASREELREHHSICRWDTAVGSVLTQAVMAAVLVTVAASPVWHNGESIKSVSDFVIIFTDVLGSEILAKWVITFAFTGACVVAAIVQTLCSAWCLEEAMGRSFDPDNLPPWSDGFVNRLTNNVSQRPVFYIAYFITLGCAFFITLLSSKVATALNIWTQFCNGVLMPPIVFALWYLSSYALPEDLRLGPVLKYSLFIVFFICSAFCVISVVFVIQDPS